jgi:hypothetical protein
VADDVAYGKVDVASDVGGSDDTWHPPTVTWTNQMLTRGTFKANGWVPRGPITGCHVAPRV